MDDIAATSKELEFLTKVLRQVSAEMEKATGAESKNSAEAKKMVATYNELTKTASNLEGAIKNQFKQMQSTQQMLQKLGKTEEEVVDIQKNMVKVLLGEIPASKQVAQAFKEQAKVLRELKKKEEEAIAVGKSLEKQTKSLSGKFEDVTKRLSNVVGWKTALGGALGLSFGIKELGSTLSRYNRDLFESTRIAKTYGESLGSLKRGIEEASQKTTLSKQAFVEINKTFKEMYVGVPLTTSAVANLASKLQNNLGYSAEMTTKAMQDLLSLQSRMPDVVDRVSDAIDAYSSGSGSAIQKTMALRGHLRDLGLSTQEVRKQMLMIKPPDLETKGLLGYEKTEADRAKAATDAQLSVAQKLENQMKLLNKSMTAMLKLFQIIPASVIQLGAALVGVAAVAPGLARVGTAISTMRIEAMAATRAFTMLRGAASGIGGGGAMMGRGATMVGAGSPLLPGATRIPLSAARTARTAGVATVGANAATTTTSTGRMARMGAGVGSAASMGGMIAGIAQISGLQSVAAGGTEAARANEEEWGEASAGRKIGMSFTGKGLAAGASRFGRGAGAMYEKGGIAIARQEMGDVKDAFAKQGIWGGLKQSGKAFGGYMTGGASLTGKYADKADKEDEMLTKGTVGKKKFMEGILLKRNAMPGESVDDLKKQNDLRQKAATLFAKHESIMKKTKEYQDALASKDVSKTIQMEKDLREKVEKVVEKTIPGIKNVVKIQEDNNQKLNDEVDTRSKIQDQITRTISMIKLSQEKLGDVKGATENLLALAEQGLISPEGIKSLQELAQSSANDLALSQKKANAMIIDAATRMGGTSGDMLEKIMSTKSKGEQKKYSEWKGVLLEISGLEKKIVAEDETTTEGKKNIENYKAQVAEKEKLAKTKRPDIQINAAERSKMQTATVDELKGIQRVMDKKRNNIELNKEDKKVQDGILTKSLDASAQLKLHAEATADVETKKKSAADISMGAATVEMKMGKNLTGLEQERAAAESRRAKAYNLGVHAGYEALNKQIDAAKKYIGFIEKEQQVQQEKLRNEMKLAGMMEGKDYDVNASPAAISLAFTKKRIALEKAGDKDGIQKLDERLSSSVNFAREAFKQGTELANKQAEITELTKEVMEGYLAANKEFIANAGVFSGIIGSTKKGITQLLGKEVRAAGGKALGQVAGSEYRGGAAPRYSSSGSGGGGVIGMKGANPNEEITTKRNVAGVGTASGVRMYDKFGEYTAAAREELSRTGGARALDTANKTSPGISTGAGPRHLSPQPPGPYQSPYSLEDVGAGLPKSQGGQSQGGPTESGYVISKQKTDQHKDLIAQLNPSIVQGGVAGKDSVFISGIGWTMPGEAIVTGDEESALAEMINKGQIEGFARGGSTTRAKSRGSIGGFNWAKTKMGKKSTDMGGIKSLGGAQLNFSKRGSNIGQGIVGGFGGSSGSGGKASSDSDLESLSWEKGRDIKDISWGGAVDYSKNKDVVAAMSMRHSLSNQTPSEQATNMNDNTEIARMRGLAAPFDTYNDASSKIFSKSGGRFGQNTGIRTLASGGAIQVPRGLARQFASSPASSEGGEMTLKLNPEVRDLLVADGRTNYRSGTRV